MICLNEKATFEENKINFYDHTRSHHEIWLYVYYIQYLKDKDELDYTGDEIDVWEKFSQNRTDWMPLNSTLFLRGVKYIAFNLLGWSRRRKC